MKKEKKYKVTYKGCRIVEANNKKELITKINSPDFMNAIEHLKRINGLLE